MARPRSDLKPRIVHAARARFLHDGVDGASLREIARDAGTTIGMVYYYFPTKDELFLAVAEEVYARLVDDLAHAMTPDVPVPERLRRLFARFGRLTDDEADVVRLVVREALVSNTRLERMLERSLRGHIPLLVATLSEGQQNGTLRDDLSLLHLLAATFSLAMAPQIARRRLSAELPIEVPSGAALAEALSGVLLRGLTPGRETGSPAPSAPPTG